MLGVVGRNGMGKTTLCNAITGLVPARGSVKLAGREILGLSPNAITELGIGYVPQGRRVWPSLTVDEHLRLAAKRAPGAWTVERIYALFPRLAERTRNGGAELSGGEQQMLAIGRALLFNPRVLVMDEPTEGLAPVIVEQVVERRCSSCARDVEGEDRGAADRAEHRRRGRRGRPHRRDGQRPHRARDVGRELAADRDLQERLLGVRAQREEERRDAGAGRSKTTVPRVLTVRRAHGEGAPRSTIARAVRGFTRWNAVQPRRRCAIDVAALAPRASAAPSEAPPTLSPTHAPRARVRVSGREQRQRAAYIAGTFDTKGRELFFLQQCIEKLGCAR